MPRQHYQNDPYSQLLHRLPQDLHLQRHLYTLHQQTNALAIFQQRGSTCDGRDFLLNFSRAVASAGDLQIIGCSRKLAVGAAKNVVTLILRF
jgi:hypothetical protein